MSFKDQVINIVRQIPYGRVTTYGTVAALAGVPRGARLVGGQEGIAVSANFIVNLKKYGWRG